MPLGCEVYQSAAGILRRDAHGVILLDEPRSLAQVANAGMLATLSSAAGRRAPEAIESLLPPLASRRIILVGLNYQSHAAEVGQPTPTKLIWAELPNAALTGQDSVVVPPAGSEGALDYEGEIAVIVGNPLDKADEASAAQAIAAIAGAIDFTARDLQMRALAASPGAPSIADAKTFTGSKAIGPGINLWNSDVGDVSLVTRVNGEERQRCRLADMVFSPAAILSEISQSLPLLPGDVVFTGTPAGVGFTAQRFLKHGDVVEVELGSMPALRVTVSIP